MNDEKIASRANVINLFSALRNIREDVERLKKFRDYLYDIDNHLAGPLPKPDLVAKEPGAATNMLADAQSISAQLSRTIRECEAAANSLAQRLGGIESESHRSIQEV